MVSPAACISLVDVVHVLRQSGTVLPLVVRQAWGWGEGGGGGYQLLLDILALFKCCIGQVDAF